jgi:ABC-type glutathione transport system ATPase component
MLSLTEEGETSHSIVQAREDPPRQGAAAMTNGAAQSQPKMVVEAATKYYATQSGPVHALDNVSLEVREGEFLCILGPSGCTTPSTGPK